MRSWVDHPRAQTVPGTNSGSFAPRGFSPFFHASIAGLVPGNYPVHVGTRQTAIERASQLPAAGPLASEAERARRARLYPVYVASDKIARLENPVSEEIAELLDLALVNREARRLGEMG